MSAKKQKILNNVELAMFFEQMAMIVDAGISPAEGIMVMIDDSESDSGTEILEKIREKCDEGASFYSALVASEVFPKYALDMVEIGEKSGNLDVVMKSLAFYYNREENIAKGIKNAITYPFLIIAMMLVVILVLVIKVMPIFNDVFKQLGSEMTGVSKSMLDFGNSLSKYSVVFICIFIVLGLLFIFMSRTTAGKNIRAKVFSKFILTRTMYDRIASGRFASGMALTMSAGLDTDESIDMASKLVANKRMEEKISKCKELMLEGKSFSEALSASKIFSSSYSRMIMVGYRAGAMDKVLEKIANGYEEEVDERISNIISVLEPTLVIVLSIFICVILLSVMLPLMGIMTSIG